ncbi:MAG: hypothetical protein KGJ90_05100 [Patescibacteria group bacterium]|nr:hypothetical protein [Patescibacteria group bacterium]
MSTTTTNYGFTLPAINSATDADAWGTQLNGNWTSMDSLLLTATNKVHSAKTSNTTIDSTYKNKLIQCDASGGAFTLTLNAASALGDGFTFAVKKTDSSVNAVTITPNGGDTIDGASTDSISAQYTTKIYVSDGTNWNVYSSNNTVTPSVKTVKKQVFTSNGTYTPSSGMLYCIIEAIGGGGGGGGSATNGYGAAGGGAGGYCKIVASSGTVGASQAVTIGSAGTAGAIGAKGGNGGNTTFGSILTANGGTGGTFAPTAAAFLATGGVGGTASGGDINITGQTGGGYYADAVNYAGVGGSSIFGTGGLGLTGWTPATGFTANGNAGNGYGAGGSGAFNSNSGTGKTGGAGTGGIIIITEYCSQ